MCKVFDNGDRGHAKIYGSQGTYAVYILLVKSMKFEYSDDLCLFEMYNRMLGSFATWRSFAM